MTYSVNCSILLTELPLLERPAAAKAAGFDAVEFWWPFARPSPPTPRSTRFERAITDAGVQLTGLNFNAGDMPGGDRGLVSWIGRCSEFKDNIDVVAGIGGRLGCTSFNALYGNRQDGHTPEAQDELAVQNLAAAAAGSRRHRRHRAPRAGQRRPPLPAPHGRGRRSGSSPGSRRKPARRTSSSSPISTTCRSTVTTSPPSSKSTPRTSATSRSPTTPAAGLPEPVSFPSANGSPAAANSATRATSASNTRNRRKPPSAGPSASASRPDTRPRTQHTRAKKTSVKEPS